VSGRVVMRSRTTTPPPDGGTPPVQEGMSVGFAQPLKEGCVYAFCFPSSRLSPFRLASSAA